MLYDILTYAAAVLAGVIVALRVIAPRTKTKKDDKALEYAEKAEEVIGNLKPKK